MLTTAAARETLVRNLLTDADAHDAGRYDEIGRRFDSFEHAFPLGDAGELTELRIALTFWDSWIDARNHGWQPTAGIQPEEWPALARGIATDLAALRPIGSERMRKLFDADLQSGLGDRVHILADRLRERARRV